MRIVINKIRTAAHVGKRRCLQIAEWTPQTHVPLKIGKKQSGNQWLKPFEKWASTKDLYQI